MPLERLKSLNSKTIFWRKLLSQKKDNKRLASLELRRLNKISSKVNLTV